MIIVINVNIHANLIIKTSTSTEQRLHRNACTLNETDSGKSFKVTIDNNPLL